MTIAYVDGDIILYQSAFLSVSEFDGDPVMDPVQAEKIFDILLGKWLGDLKPRAIRLCFTGPHNFRKDLWPSYKANRKDRPKPMVFETLKERVTHRHTSILLDGVEADDVMGMAASAKNSDAVIVSTDKDFMTVPGVVWHPKQHKRIVTTEAEANLNWMRQTITGDSTDNYPGIPGFGPIKAATLLPCEAPLPHLWQAVVSAYTFEGLSPSHALCMARMARILREGDYDDDEGVRLWTP